MVKNKEVELPASPKESKTKKTIREKIRMTLATLFVLTSLAGVSAIVYIVNDYITLHTFKVRTPIIVQSPVVIERRADKLIAAVIASGREASSSAATNPSPTPYVQMNDREIADYIKSKNWDYSVALRVAKSENFYNERGYFDCSRTHVNKNGTIDVGIFQINQVHKKRVESLYGEGSFVLAMADCKKNIDVAYAIYTEQSWAPWIAYTSGRYKEHDLTLLDERIKP